MDARRPRAWAGETAGERPNDSIAISIGRGACSRCLEAVQAETGPAERDTFTTNER